MSLINCSECGKDISDQAKACPNCGMPIKKKGKGFAVASLVLGIIACVYSLPVITAVYQPDFNAMNTIGIAINIMIFSLLSLVFGIVSHVRGCKLKKKNAGIILGTISAIILLMCIILSVV